jgi:hypothetical protein
MANVPSATRNRTILVVKGIPIADFSIRKTCFYGVFHVCSRDNGRVRNDSYWLDTLIMMTKARRRGD